MPNAQQTYEQVTQLISAGKTEKAIELLKSVLKNNPHAAEDSYETLILLSGQYSSWERSHLQGVSNDAKELNRINRNLLEVVKDLRQSLPNPAPQATTRPQTAFAPPPPPPATPDPLRVATQQVPVQPHPRRVGGGFGSLKKYATWVLVGLGVLFIIALIVPTDDDPALPSEENQFQSLFATGAVDPTTPLALAITSPQADEAANQLADVMGASTWFNNQLGELTMDGEGIEGVYCNGYCKMTITHFDLSGKYYGTWEDRTTGTSLYGLFTFQLPVAINQFVVIAAYPDNSSNQFLFTEY